MEAVVAGPEDLESNPVTLDEQDLFGGALSDSDDEAAGATGGNTREAACVTKERGQSK